MNTLIQYLGQNSYPAVIQKISDKFRDANCDTQVGNTLVSEAFMRLNESTTPILDLKEFTTNAEKVAPDDAKLMDIIAFARKEVKDGCLNTLINIAKEEHLQNHSRAGMPGAESTIKSMEDLFGEPSTVIEQGIKNGLFDSLDSKLLNELKKVLADNTTNTIERAEDNLEITNVNKSIDLNESVNYFGNLAIYSPVAVRLEDVPNNRILMLTENAVLTFDKKQSTFYALNESEMINLDIPSSYKRLMGAMQSLAYNPETTTFALNENWDFNLSIDKDGAISLEKDGKSGTLPKEAVLDFLMESINNYETTASSMGQTFPKLSFVRDADNFVMLLENHSQLIKLDQLKTIRNLNENTFVTVDSRKDIFPVLITSSEGPKLFESYIDLVEGVNVMLKESVNNIFAAGIEKDAQFINEKNERISKLNESQKEINQALKDISNLKNLAEADSPALDQLNENENNLTVKLDENLKTLDFVVNKANRYFNPFTNLNESTKLDPNKIADRIWTEVQTWDDKHSKGITLKKIQTWAKEYVVDNSNVKDSDIGSQDFLQWFDN